MASAPVPTDSSTEDEPMKILVPVKRVVDYNVKIRVKRGRLRASSLPTSRCR